MKNTLMTSDNVYQMIRSHCLNSFPYPVICRPQLTVNFALKSSGSALHAPAPGLNFSHRTDDVISDFDKFVIEDKNREALFDDIFAMVNWLAFNGYLRPDRNHDDLYEVTDKLLQTPSLIAHT